MIRSNATAHGAAVVLLFAALTGCSTVQADPLEPRMSASTKSAELTAKLEHVANEFDAMLGVSAIDTGSGERVSFNADRRFGFASTLKVMAAAKLLHDVRPMARDEIATWSQDDVDAAGYSPVTEEHVSSGLSLNQLAEAAVRTSDNTAMNIILQTIGGPEGLDAGLEQLGDHTTDVVDNEPALNEIDPDNTANTSTAASFTSVLTTLIAGTYLTPSDEDVLIDWMSENATGDTLLRAGAPENWVVADKSGGSGGIRNDAAIVTPPGREPIVITVFSAKNNPRSPYDDALVASAGRIVLNSFN